MPKLKEHVVLTDGANCRKSNYLLQFIFRVGSASMGFGMVGEEEREIDTRFTMVWPIVPTSI